MQALWLERYSTEAYALTLPSANPSLISRISYGPLSTTKSYPWAERANSKPWVSLSPNIHKQTKQNTNFATGAMWWIPKFLQLGSFNNTICCWSLLRLCGATPQSKNIFLLGPLTLDLLASLSKSLLSLLLDDLHIWLSWHILGAHKVSSSPLLKNEPTSLEGKLGNNFHVFTVMWRRQSDFTH